MAQESDMFMVNQTVGSILCCKSGIPMQPNAANMCANCLRSEVDITEGLQKHVVVVHCPECDTYLQLPRTWIKAQLESKELLTFCIKRFKNMNKVRLVDAIFVWTEPHSKRMNFKLEVQKEVLHGAIIEQVYTVEYVVQDQMCDTCARIQANPDQWVVLNHNFNCGVCILGQCCKSRNWMAEEAHGLETTSSPDEWDPIIEDVAMNKRKLKRKRMLLREAQKADKRGVCYLSRIPPNMDPSILRQMLSQYGEVGRIYLAPVDSAGQVHRKRAGGVRGQVFSEGWVEFKKKSVAKRVANMLNGEQIGGRKRSSFYYDIWNIKYLSKFKWDDLTGEKAEKNATHMQKLELETSAARKERQFYINNLNKSIALKNIKERRKKKLASQQDSGELYDDKVVRQFHQKKPIADESVENQGRLPKSFLQGIFGGRSAL